MGDPKKYIYISVCVFVFVYITYIYICICRYICVYIMSMRFTVIYLYLYTLFFDHCYWVNHHVFFASSANYSWAMKSYVKSPDQHARVACSFCSQSCLRIARETATGPWRLDTNKKQPEIRLVVAVGFEMAGVRYWFPKSWVRSILTWILNISPISPIDIG